MIHCYAHGSHGGGGIRECMAALRLPGNERGANDCPGAFICGVQTSSEDSVAIRIEMGRMLDSVERAIAVERRQS